MKAEPSAKRVNFHYSAFMGIIPPVNFFSEDFMSSRGNWGGRIGFILAAAGSAVGLGNIWKFPYVVGRNGGGAFYLIYIAAVLFAGIPLMIAEIYIGHKTEKSPISAFKTLQTGRIPFSPVGFAGVLTGTLILSFYSVITGWIFHYFFLSLGGFSGSDESIKGLFGELASSPWINIGWHSLVMLIVVLVIIKGVEKGIEKVSKILMPALGVLLIVLVVYSAFSSGFRQAVKFMFYPDFSQVTGHSMLEALGTAFFTLSLGMGAMITYGSYIDKKGRVSYLKTSLQIATIDTVIATMAGLIIFPIVFSNGLEADSGPSLIFKTLPVLFARIPGGRILAILFFLLVIFAAITSAISLLEVCVSSCVDEFKWSRMKSTIVFGVLIWLLGILSAVSSLNINGKGFLDIFDGLTSHYLMPVGGLATIIIFAWAIPTSVKESDFGKTKTFNVILFVTRFVTPVLLAIVLLNEIGIF